MKSLSRYMVRLYVTTCDYEHTKMHDTFFNEYDDANRYYNSSKNAFMTSVRLFKIMKEHNHEN